MARFTRDGTVCAYPSTRLSLANSFSILDQNDALRLAILLRNNSEGQGTPQMILGRNESMVADNSSRHTVSCLGSRSKHLLDIAVAKIIPQIIEPMTGYSARLLGGFKSASQYRNLCLLFDARAAIAPYQPHDILSTYCSRKLFHGLVFVRYLCYCDLLITKTIYSNFPRAQSWLYPTEQQATNLHAHQITSAFLALGLERLISYGHRVARQAGEASNVEILTG